MSLQLAALRGLVHEVLVITNQPAPFAGQPVRIISDRRPGLGPLAGLEAALMAAEAEHVLVVGGDMPGLQPAALRLLVDEDPACDAVLFESAHGPEPLCARYARRVLPLVSARLDAGRLALHGLLDDLRTSRIGESRLRAVDPGLLTLANVNTPDDLERVLASLARVT